MSPTEGPETRKNSLAWRIKFLETAEKQFEKLDRSTQRAINSYIVKRLATVEDPKRFGKPLLGNLKELWRYRIGDYRLICKIYDQELLILVVRIGHRREVYEA